MMIVRSHPPPLSAMYHPSGGVWEDLVSGASFKMLGFRKLKDATLRELGSRGVYTPSKRKTYQTTFHDLKDPVRAVRSDL